MRGPKSAPLVRQSRSQHRLTDLGPPCYRPRHQDMSELQRTSLHTHTGIHSDTINQCAQQPEQQQASMPTTPSRTITTRTNTTTTSRDCPEHRYHNYMGAWQLNNASSFSCSATQPILANSNPLPLCGKWCCLEFWSLSPSTLSSLLSWIR
jgi:hypothetical protein